MNYELAKKLKDAGFPVKKGLRDSWHGQAVFFDGETSDDNEKIYFEAPHLEELIDACTKHKRVLYFELQGYSGDWMAFNGGVIQRDDEGRGKTPLIAVANLWLKLHEPHHTN